jgi:hypothetical protein
VETIGLLYGYGERTDRSTHKDEYAYFNEYADHDANPHGHCFHHANTNQNGDARHHGQFNQTNPIIFEEGSY